MIFVEIRASTFRHAEGNCGKKHAKIDDFPSKFEHQHFDTPKVIAARGTPKSTADSRQNYTTKNRHAECNCVKNHAKIDDFSSKFEHQILTRRRKLRQEAHQNQLLTVAKIPPRKIDTPKVIAAKSTQKSMIFRRNSIIQISTA